MISHYFFNIAEDIKREAGLGEGRQIELHHVEGTQEGGTKPMTFREHRGPGNYKENHPWVNKNKENE